MSNANITSLDPYFRIFLEISDVLTNLTFIIEASNADRDVRSYSFIKYVDPY
jgi:hypothetical protein